jgi:hypothetical protein
VRGGRGEGNIEGDTWMALEALWQAESAARGHWVCRFIQQDKAQNGCCRTEIFPLRMQANVPTYF